MTCGFVLERLLCLFLTKKWTQKRVYENGRFFLPWDLIDHPRPLNITLLLMLAYQVEGIIFPKKCLQKIMPLIQFYLFAQVYLNLTNHFFIILQNKCKKIVKIKPKFSVDEFRPELDFLCVHGTFCVHNTVHVGAVFFLYIQCYLLAHSVQLMCVPCNLYTLMLPMWGSCYLNAYHVKDYSYAYKTIYLTTVPFFHTAQFLYTQFNVYLRYSLFL